MPSAAAEALRTQSHETPVDSDLHIIIVFCLIGLLLALCATILLPGVAVLGQFTLS